MSSRKKTRALLPACSRALVAFMPRGPSPAQASAASEALTTGRALMGTGSTRSRFTGFTAAPRPAQSEAKGLPARYCPSSQSSSSEAKGKCAARAQAAAIAANSR
ncbi:MAG: hypothetical protein CVU79_12945 [Elusimicrobia bacterium HGW-Elusimicrobia-3]|nr:MAG: hypothetical protein CVU79_12945 [Elusimicrobia bacterium HGW-Elusimicrobia-3]